jgi:ketosteroid isomerase-like protein
VSAKSSNPNRRAVLQASAGLGASALLAGFTFRDAGDVKTTGPGKTMDPIATVTAYYEAFATHDLDRLPPFFAPDAVWVIPGDPALTPWAGTRTGPEEIRDSLAAFFEYVQPLNIERRGMTETGEGQVLVQLRYTSRFTSPAHPAGTEFSSEAVARFTVRKGRITAYRIFEDSLGITRAAQGEPIITSA